MKRWLIALMLPLMAGTAVGAEWTRVGYGDEFIQYVDSVTILRNKNFVKMLDMKDYKVQQNGAGYSFFSSKAQSEYDCKERKWRQLAFSWLSGQMGNGRAVVFGTEALNWMPIEPESIGEILWGIACGRK